MKKILTLTLGLVVLILPVFTEAAIDSINGLTSAIQSLVSPGSNATNSMHMDIIQVGSDTHRFRWDGSPWRVDQGGTGATSFASGSVLFFSDNKFSENNALLNWNNEDAILFVGAINDPPSVPSVGTVRIGRATLATQQGEGCCPGLIIDPGVVTNRIFGTNDLIIGGGESLTEVGGNVLIQGASGFGGSGPHGSVIIGNDQNHTNEVIIGSNNVVVRFAGGCIAIADSDGEGVTYITANDGVLFSSSDSC